MNSISKGESTGQLLMLEGLVNKVAQLESQQFLVMKNFKNLRSAGES